MNITDLKNIEKTTSFVKGQNLYLIDTNHNKTHVLLDEQKALIENIYSDLTKILRETPRNTEETRSKEYQTIEVKNKDYTKKIVVEQKHNKKITTTFTKYNDNPNIEGNELLLFETIIAILVLMKKIQNNLDIDHLINEFVKTESKDYKPLSDVIDFINQSDMEKSNIYINQKFQDCKKEYTSKAIKYIFTTVLSPTKTLFVLNIKIETLIKELLILADYGELGLDATIAQFRT
ncbi:hypothetical protein [Olleya sp. HaHaR_3_96]|uniref:hypothetical protein n=1 Tax=Olleya sp. HaHaR_3_96 TaxID=2745560 RepID=UPI001C4F2388|nr:hypothetical protein [Olleya sp. HaHaR_3_96]QXP60840.1 hypothetical protein H0I26_04165 [Olleya sp. HaHaR_3_96]